MGIIAGVGAGKGAAVDSGFFDLLLLLPKTPLKILNLNPFFSSFMDTTLTSLVAVAIDPRDPGLGTSIMSCSIDGTLKGLAGTIESKVTPYSCTEGLEGITINRRFGNGFEAFKIGIGNPFSCAW